MKFYNISDRNETVNFQEGVLRGAGTGKGLFFPARIPDINLDAMTNRSYDSLPELAAFVLDEYVKEDFSGNELYDICHAAFNFPIPLVEVEEKLFALELFHGPSLAFKDVGARFLSEVLRKIAIDKGQKITVLVATSGDTGSAVAKSFYEVAGVQVVLLYPSGKVSSLQEKTLTTLGQNIHALEVEGTFDDCQQLVKQAFDDKQLNQTLQLTSANSINIGRFLPQIVYYFWAWKQLNRVQQANTLFSVPSGNYGNLSAGILAQKMGLPVQQFIAASNVNRVVPDFLDSGDYVPRSSVSTYSNAMDVGNPSNFVRLKELFGGSLQTMRSLISSHIATDDEVLAAIAHLYAKHGYLADPHGVIGYLGAKKYAAGYSATIFLETAHPAKFKTTVEKAIPTEVELPDYLKDIQNKEKKATRMSAEFDSFKEWMLSMEWG